MNSALAVAVILVGGLTVSAMQPSTSARRVRDIQNVRGNLYFITGGDSYEVGGRPIWTGGNVAVFVTRTGVVVVDFYNDFVGYYADPERTKGNIQLIYDGK